MAKDLRASGALERDASGIHSGTTKSQTLLNDPKSKVPRDCMTGGRTVENGGCLVGGQGGARQEDSFKGQP